MDKKNFSAKLYPLNKDIARTWFIRVVDNTGRPKKMYGKLNHFNTVDERLKEYKRIIRELKKPVRIEYSAKATLTKNLCDALNLREPLLSKKSYQCYLSMLKNFGQWYLLEFSKNRDINPALYINELYRQNKHSNYIRKYKQVLSMLFTDVAKKGLYNKTNPFADIKIRKLKSKSLFTFSREQMTLLKKEIAANDEQLSDVIHFLYYLLFRPKELRLLKIENILFDTMQVFVDTKITKDKDVFYKAIPEQLQPLILKYKGYPNDYYVFSRNGLPGIEKLSENSLYNRHRIILQQLGFAKNYSLYSWVHTGCKEAALSGVPLKQLQLQKGHSDLKTFDEYLKNIGVNDCKALITSFPTL